MEDGVFNKDDLIPLECQFTVTWHNVSDFKLGQKVFLKSNPELPMIVHELGDDFILTSIDNKNRDIQYIDFKPEMLLQYNLACLVTYNRYFPVCLN